MMPAASAVVRLPRLAIGEAGFLFKQKVGVRANPR